MTWIRSRDHSLIANATSLFVCGLLAGLVVAAAAFPAIAMGGLAAKAGAEAFESLPTDLDVLPAPQITKVYASDGTTLLAHIYDENRFDVESAEIAEVMKQALVASEDSRFYQHNGVDMKGVARAFIANQQTGAVTQGASTLTMQYVRQVITYTAKTPSQVVKASEDTPERKIHEIKRAITLEKKISKDKILELYLNIASFGHGAYGIFAASQVYFGKTPKELQLPEAALLAGLVQAPSAYDPADPQKKPEALKRREYVLSQMVKMNYITQAQADEAKKAELTIRGERTAEGCAEVLRPELGAGFFCDYLLRWWNEQEKFGKDGYERSNRLRSSGYTIISSLDVNAQSGAVRNIGDIMKGKPVHQAMMLVGIEPGSGRVQLMATNRKFSNDQSRNGSNTLPEKRARGVKGNYPNTTVPLLSGGGDIQGYQVGSVFKIFTIVAALERGLPLDYTINTVSPYKSKYPVEASSPAACPGTTFYCPENFGKKSMGVRDMWTGLGSSVNTYFVPLQERIGTEKVVDVTKRLGIQYHTPDDQKLAANASLWGAFTLGVTTNTPLEMANAYATLAADGMYCKPTPIRELRDSKNRKLEGGEADCKKAIEPDVARAAVDAARCPLGDQSAFGKCSGATTAPDTRGIVGRPVAGKTGTTEGEKAATLAAMTKQLAVFGEYTDPDWPQTRERFEHRGGVNPAVQRTLRDAMKDKPAINFTPPSRDMAFGKRVGIPNVKCASVEQARSRLRAAGFEVAQANGRVASDCPPGSVAGTDPSGSTVKGGVVVMEISGGPGEPSPGGPPDVPGPPRGGGGGPGGGGPGGGGGGPGTNPCRLAPWLCPDP